MNSADHSSVLHTKSIFVVISVVIASILIDTSIVKISVYTGGLTGSIRDILTFTVITSIYVVAQFVLLKLVINREQFRSPAMILIRKSVIALQFILVGFLAISIIQMLLISSYSSIILKLVTWINYSMSIVFLGLLAWKFISWFSSRRNKVLVAYSLAIVLLCINNTFAILDLTYVLTGQQSPEYIRPTKSSVGAMITGYITLSTAYFITSVLSFVSTWLATVLLLHHYATKIGKTKYWIIVSIPLVYFLTQYQTVLLALFTPIRIADPILFSITYTLAFSASKPMGGILFGIAFWIVSRGLSNRQVKDYMIISGYGLLLLFTANQHQVLELNPYPPFGLPTISYVGLASFLILVGVYSSALSVANDAELRRSIWKSVKENSGLLGNIGEAQFVDQLQKKVISKTKALSKKLEEETGIASSLEDNDIHDYVMMAIKEAKRARVSNT